jgi:hypothetical protein
MWTILASAWTTTVTTLARFHTFIADLRGVFGTLRFHPIAPVLGSLPAVLARPLEHQLSAGPVTMAERELLVRLWRRTDTRGCDVSGAFRLDAGDALQIATSTPPKVTSESAVTKADRETSLLTALIRASACCARRLAPLWRRCEGSSSEGSLPAGQVGDQERFIGAVVAHIVTRYLRLVRFFVISIAGGCLSLLLGVAAYPFSTRQTLIVLVVLLTVCAAFVTARAYLILERDHILSLLAKTPPGQVTLRPDLVLRLAMTVLLPLSSLTLTQYPDLLNGLFSWLSPLSDALR